MILDTNKKLIKVTYEGVDFSLETGSPKFAELVDGSITTIEESDLSDVTTIRDDVFANLEITSVEIPSNVTSIGDSAFANNEISSLTLNEGVQTIGASAFANNPITTLTIPSTVTSIGVSAFGGTQLIELDMSNVHTPPTVDATSFPSTLTAIHVAYGDYDAYLSAWSDYADKIVRGLAIPSTITVTVNNYLGELVSGASVTISGNGQTYTGTTDMVGVFSQGDLQPATYTISVADLEGFKTPETQEVVVGEDTQNSVIVTYLEKPAGVVYGVKIDLANSDPETSVTYTDDSEGFDKSYMDFDNTSFVYGSWQDKFPFNEIKPCILKNGVVTTYLNPNNYEQDIDGNTVNIKSGCDGDVMIEIPKIYYRLHKDDSYQYIQISNTYQEGFCCLAHTYKGVEKDKVYVGAFTAVYDSSKGCRSISDTYPTASRSIVSWRTSAQQKGNGYELIYWNLLVLIQCLYTIQFKNLDSQTALGFGYCSNQYTQASGALNKKGLYYGESNPSGLSHNTPAKFIGIENIYGNLKTFVDGIYANSSKEITFADMTNSDTTYNETGEGYVARFTQSGSFSSSISKIVGDNNGGFYPHQTSGSRTTYYCDNAETYSPSLRNYVFGGAAGGTGFYGGMYYLGTTASDYEWQWYGARLAYCG